ncbi:MAG: peptidoglycan editing factor PgeF [Legionellaceae bacterium]|nr:peptidoglycan editing factor PgeF [Legionellaceae bacterium]
MTNLIANWPAPKHIKALTTSRLSGHSQQGYADNNLGLHVNDDPKHVHANRDALINQLQLPNEPIWLDQTHSNRCVVVENVGVDRQADAAVTRDAQFPLAIMTADCLPIVICDNQGTEIAAIHAGWRGLANGIIENTLASMRSAASSCLAWIGPAICAACYETGEEVLQTFTDRYSFAHQAFYQDKSHLHANLPQMAELILYQLGISAIYQSNACTFELHEQFYSYRRAAQTGRMATLIWFQDNTL